MTICKADFAEEVAKAKEVAEMIVSMQNACELRPVDFSSEKDMQYLYAKIDRALKNKVDYYFTNSRKYLSHVRQ